MMLPKWFKPGAWGAVAGAAALVVVVSSTGWVVSSGNADQMAKARSEKAVLAALAPICVAQFKSGGRAGIEKMWRNKSASAETQGVQLAALKKEDEWKRAAFVSKKGWATMPGSSQPNSEVATVCAEELMKLTKQAK